MRAFINYLTAWLRSTSRPALLLTTLLVASLVAANYTVGIETHIRALPWYFALGGFFLFYLLVLALVWGLQYKSNKTPLGQPKLLILLGLAPLYFALKMLHWDLLPLLSGLRFPWAHYTQVVLQLPLKLGLLFLFLRAFHKSGFLSGDSNDSLGAAVGLTRKNFNVLPYFGLLLCVVPLIVLASTQHDFLLVYPKMKTLAFINGYAKPEWPWKLLYELSYGLDFLGIELFF